ncbi:SDR family NAD(P)-dependent oxidoreductase [Cognatiyoonia sp. IB215446]|uniref:SDR family NAD(P)-dependent oxidoreductase n=1 Tax=Cognatiyoonia sp. IB215446 TaxID=3097355 RepID=UPI002A16C679|nr:SDR family NAD(P)-dependent oxidoreductase [Cognatiyoonia sp. IB215446]MDX8350249.1 SDR family NAD(P)-dependent oxidoreductase [Cognatiyoonia sp. IB215446]
MTHPAFNSDSVAVITGGASGIGLAAATKFARMGMRIVVVDRDAEKLAEAAEKISAAGATEVMTSEADVSDRAQLAALEQQVTDRFGGTDILMNNAGVGGKSSTIEDAAPWEKMLGINLWGPIHGTQVFAPNMIARGRPGAIINTGSKQGITTPPGNPAYNVSKAALKAFTEALSHELRTGPGHRITAHLLVPGFVYTGMISAPEKPASAWTAEQTIDFFVDSVNRGDFYILCPDNDVSRDIDEKRVAWSVGDVIENRPALSRWHPDYKKAFEAFMAQTN